MLKFAFYFLLAFACLNAVHALNLDAMKKWNQAIKDKCHDTCKDKISQDSLNWLEDDSDADNEEIRAYITCLFKCNEYYKDDQIQEQKLQDDYKSYDENATADDLDQVKKIINICMDEVKDCDNETDKVGRFVLCVKDRAKSTL